MCILYILYSKLLSYSYFCVLLIGIRILFIYKLGYDTLFLVYISNNQIFVFRIQASQFFNYILLLNMIYILKFYNLNCIKSIVYTIQIILRQLQHL